MIFVYAGMNFLLFMLHTEGGMPAVQDGKYLLLNHGKLIRQLTPSEFASFKTNELRSFSGHWLFFYFFPAAYFLFWKSPKAEPVSGGTGVYCDRRTAAFWERKSAPVRLSASNDRRSTT